MDVVFWLDILLQMITGYVLEGNTILDIKKCRNRYFARWIFKVDLLAALPYEFFLFTSELEDGIEVTATSPAHRPLLLWWMAESWPGGWGFAPGGAV